MPPPPIPTAVPRRATAVLVLVALLLAWVLARLPFLVVAAGGKVGTACSEAAAAWREAPEARIARASGVTPELIAAIRGAVPQGGRLVLFSPYPGRDFELLLRSAFERTKNLLYPEPRDVWFARNAGELRLHLHKELEQRLLVLDGTQEPTDLPVPGAFTLVGTHSLGGAGRLRLWRLDRVVD